MVGCYIWYSEEGTGWCRSLSRFLLAIPNVTQPTHQRPVDQSPCCCTMVRCSAVLMCRCKGYSGEHIWLVCAGVLTRLTGHFPVLLQPEQAEWTHHEPGALCRADCHVVCHSRWIPHCPLQEVLWSLIKLVPLAKARNNITCPLSVLQLFCFILVKSCTIV